MKEPEDPEESNIDAIRSEIGPTSSAPIDVGGEEGPEAHHDTGILVMKLCVKRSLFNSLLEFN